MSIVTSLGVLLCGSDSRRGLHEHKGLELSTKRVLEEVCELGVPERNVLGVAMEGSDHVTESGKRLVDILSLTSLITSHTGPRETLRSSEVNEVETGSAGGSCLLVLSLQLDGEDAMGAGGLLVTLGGGHRTVDLTE